MDELQEIRKLKEEGLTNPKVLEILEELRSKRSEKPKSKEKDKEKKEKEKEEKEKPEPTTTTARRVTRKVQEAPAARRKVVKEEPQEEENEEEDAEEPVVAQQKEDEDLSDADDGDEKEESAPIPITSADGKSKYSLTCQTCNKIFEHMNPRLRDCLDCYRIKRKERRRGGDKHKNVIQNPIAQQVVSKNQQAQLAQQQQQPAVDTEYSAPPAATVYAPVARVAEPKRVSVREQLNFAPVGTTPPVYQRTQVRSYRKAIEETRGITSNLKRRLERPDLPEAERRFLEQIYAYQLILHQGWKHLSEYKQMDNGGGSSSRHENGGGRHENGGSRHDNDR